MKNTVTILPHHDNVSRAQSALRGLAIDNNGRMLNVFAELVASLVNGWHSAAAPIGACVAEEADTSIEAFAQEFASVGDADIYVHRIEDKDGKLTDKITVTGNQVSEYIRKNYKAKEAVCAVSGTRRAYALPIVNVVRSELGLPPVIPNVAELEDTASNSLLSNIVTTRGLSKITPKDVARWLVEYGKENPLFTESDLVKLGLSRGRAQQAMRAYKLHKQLPKADLLGRVASGQVPMPHKEKAKELLDNIKRSGKTPVYDQLEVELASGDSQKSDRADKRKIESAIDSTSCDVVRYVLECVKANDLEAMLKVTETYSAKLNEIFSEQFSEPEN